jgi:two-component sensor histidine kinase/PAS domain-containing protein
MSHAHVDRSTDERGANVVSIKAIDAGSVKPADILMTSELATRPRKPANLAAEVAAFCELSALLAIDAQRTLKRFLELAIILCDAGSAGISLLDTDAAGKSVFRWDTLAGPLAVHLNDTTPRYFSPCGLCLDAGRTILVDRPTRAFDYFSSAVKPLMEALIVPLYDTGGLALGTIWIVCHDANRFDAEDARVMEQLAIQMVLALKVRQAQSDAARTLAEVKSLREANASLIDDGAFLRGILESSGDCIKVLDLDGRMLFMSPGGQREMEVDDFALVRGKLWTNYLDEGGRQAAKDALDLAKEGGIGRFRASAHTAKGTPKYWDVQVTPILNEVGALKQLLAISRDVSEEYKAEKQRDLLANELEHRIRNTLTMVSAIVSQTFRAASSNDDAVASVLERISALSRAQDILRKTTWTSAAMEDLMEGALAPHRTGDARYRLSGPNIFLSAKQSLSLSLAVHELATNATKYGALSDDAGHVEASWGVENIGEKAMFRFDWTEIGGPPVRKPERRGFGSRLIEMTLASDFDGGFGIEYAPSGVHCHVSSSLSRVQYGPADRLLGALSQADSRASPL